MVNLYQILELPIDATTVEINVALRKYQQLPHANPKIVRAVDEWLLVGATRKRYNARLRAEFPEFFQNDEYEIEEIAEEYDTESECEYDFFDTYTPKLWSPNKVAVAAVVISPVLGAVLTAINWRELGRDDWATPQQLWAKRFVYAHFVLAILAILTSWVWVLFLGSVLAVWWWWHGGGRAQYRFVNAHFADFVPQSWRTALIGAVVGWFVYLLAAFFMLLFAVLLGLA
ncbi:hypothetical protein [Alysiella filiformis]|uniref:Uncharacterized protein n=1 Tax=Alysiella filiformis DSM 16848 TaxID=1120981 RepID=A0A286EDL4_9NEIS|nr:hypothetical protein [Alysiella filiformis]QMT31720.1 hypothetical protein H3L97_02140 [Alysiella filiformis]UBQ55269.1 hypothetical protein JF568_06535 [Alysiella filiformis DSM 16848]SOD68990.1 hypothetical protein SAMN02746062_01471 [Alysiella filiformis DSM 16848]